MNGEDAKDIVRRFIRSDGQHSGRLYEAIEEILKGYERYEMYRDIIEDIERFCNIGGVD